MKYAVAAIALVGAVAAMPTEPEPTWETWTTTTTTPAYETWATWTTTTPYYETSTWETWAPEPTTYKCSDVKTEYYTKYDDENNKWGNYHVDTSYVTEYPSTCWENWSTTEYETKTWAPYPVEEKCYYTSIYTTKECGYDSGKWDDCKDVTKTDIKETDTCTSTWAEWTTTTEEYKTTWATWTPAETPTPYTSTWEEVKYSSTVPAPVAKWTGAANKANIAGGLAGVAGLAALLL